MNNKTPAFFRNVVANIIIASMLILMFTVTYAGGTLNAFSSSDNEPFYTGNTNNPKISLMINVYWGTEFIEPMLEVLKKYNIKTTFFVGGMWVEDNVSMLHKMFDEGHEIGNHGYFHKDHSQISLERNQDEIYITHKLVKANIGVDMNLFAPPSGSFNNITLQVAKNLGYKTIMWTKDTVDWRDKDANIIYNRAIKNPRNGDLILMHPTEKTLEALENIIKFYISKGYTLTTVGDNLS